MHCLSSTVHDVECPSNHYETENLPPMEYLDDVSSDVRKLPYTTVEASYSCPDGAASNLMGTGSATAWKAGSNSGWVLLRLHEKALLSFLRVRNRSTSEISISISVAGRRRRDFVPVKHHVRLAHHYLTDVMIGHLPCLYIRVDCRRVGSGEVSLHELVPCGIPAKGLAHSMGPSMEDLTLKSTERLLFGPSLKTSHPPVCTPAAVRRLLLPPSHLRALSNPEEEVMMMAQGDRQAPSRRTQRRPVLFDAIDRAPIPGVVVTGHCAADGDIADMSEGEFSREGTPSYPLTRRSASVSGAGRRMGEVATSLAVRRRGQTAPAGSRSRASDEAALRGRFTGRGDMNSSRSIGAGQTGGVRRRLNTVRARGSRRVGGASDVLD